jgi:hypothetical protein
MTKTDHLLFAAKELLRDALENSGATILSHGFGADRADIGFEIHGKTFCFALQLTEVPTDEFHIKPSPLPPARARRVLNR